VGPNRDLGRAAAPSRAACPRGGPPPPPKGNNELTEQHDKQFEFKRARTDEQKEQRIQQILHAARELFDRMPYEQITISEIAKKLDFKRVTLYLYFKTKEDIFLSLLNEAADAFQKDIFDAFGAAAVMRIEIFAEQMAQVIDRNKFYFELAAVHANFVAKDAKNNSLLRFTFDFGDARRHKTKNVGALLCGILPWLDEEKAIRLMHNLWHYTIGLCIDKMTIAAPHTTVRISRHTRYKMDDFITTIEKFIIIVLTGLKNLP
jgi:AcrR family transcriptional regulator